MNVLQRLSKYCLFVAPTRNIRHKPWVPKFRLLRKYQPFLQVVDDKKLYDFKFTTYEKLSFVHLKNVLAKNGLLTHRIHRDFEIILGHSGQIFDKYVPKPDDGKSLSITKEAAMAKFEDTKEGITSYRAMMKIRKHVPTFDKDKFLNSAEITYKQAHELLQNYNDNSHEMRKYVTEVAMNTMCTGMHNKTLQWQFDHNIEPPRVVHTRVQEAYAKDNLFGQLTVRFHTQQRIALYDRFGRLIHGHPDRPVDVLEYVVFERLLTDEYGVWRIHDKLDASPVEATLSTEVCA